MNPITEQYAAATAEYLTRLKFQNLSPKTLRNYESTLRLFGDYLAASDTDDLYEAVEGWKETMLRNGSAPSSVNSYLTQLGAFFTKAAKRSFPKDLRFSENPVAEVEAVKEVKRPYAEILTDEQVALLYRDEPPKNAKNSLWPRNYAMVMLLVNEKIRNAELLDLTPENIDFRHHELTVDYGKGRKQRTVDLSPLSEAALLRYLASGIRPAASDSAPLFGTTAAHEKAAGATQGSEKWHRGTTQWLSELVERHVCAVTGVHDVRSHDLRHIGSRVCLNAGSSLEQLQGELGHADLKTTAIYSGKLLARRRRESAQAVLQVRDAAAQKLNEQLEQLDLFAEKEERLAV